MKDDPIEEARKVILDFFRTQINMQVQTVTGIVIALFSEGIATTFLSEELRLPVFLFGVGFFGSLALCQWAKMFWYGRLWNATLVAKPNTSIFERQELKDKNYEKTYVVTLLLGADSLFINSYFKHGNVKYRYAVLIFLGLKTMTELIFCIPVGFVLSTLFVYYPRYPIISVIFLAPLACQTVIFTISFIFLVVLIFWIRFHECCSSSQIKGWLSLANQDLKLLVN
jgi:hypothetical protein